MKTISANYRDRNNYREPWLIRETSEGTETYTAVESIFARDVVFVPSNESESGFGCRIVAQSDSTQAENPPMPSDSVRLRFNGGNNFYVSEDVPHCWVQSVKELWLTNKGEMYAKGIKLLS